MNDMSQVIIPKSDQINADDLISGPITVTIKAVAITAGTEQPVSIDIGIAGKVYRPCKSMSRVLVAAWGPDAKAYIGRSLTLYRDPTVKWGGMDVGGIRISHLSHIDKDMTMALTATRAQRKPFTVRALKTKPTDAPRPSEATRVAPTPRDQPSEPPVADDDVISVEDEDNSAIKAWADQLEHTIDTAPDRASAVAEFNAAAKTDHWQALKESDKPRSDALKLKAANWSKVDA